jgi:2-hydroxy-6-oxonona-2,4-dienedioate hydrolase
MIDYLAPGVRELEMAVLEQYGAKPREFYLQLTDPEIRIRGVEVGTGTGEPVLFLHALSLSAVHWSSLVPFLEKYRCLLIDIPGHGGSDQVNFVGIDLRRWSNCMLAGILEQLGVASAHIVGHSYGGLLALWLGLDHPDLVCSVVVMGTPAVAFGATPDLDLRLLALPVIGPLFLRMPSPRWIYRLILSRSLGTRAVVNAPPDLIRATQLATRRSGFATTVSSYLREQFHGVRNNPPRYRLDSHELRNMKPPVLVVWGDMDKRYQTLESAMKATELIPNHRFEMVHAGHEPWLDEPQICGALVSGFLSDRS